jgi:hypothetical protein
MPDFAFDSLSFWDMAPLNTTELDNSAPLGDYA